MGHIVRLLNDYSPSISPAEEKSKLMVDMDISKEQLKMQHVISF